jgi:spore coat protein CotF
MSNIKLEDQVILRDALASQKALTQTYSLASNEVAGNNGLRSDMLGILLEEHQLQSAMFNAMVQKGWYEAEQAQPEEIARVLKKYDQPRYKTEAEN